MNQGTDYKSVFLPNILSFYVEDVRVVSSFFDVATLT